MGREAFATVWEKWREIAPQIRNRQAIYVYGSSGYGKSHILVALACLLVCGGERVVYIPDCRLMLQQPLAYLQAAFLFAFADPESSAQPEVVLRCETVEDLVTFSRQYKETGRLCFVIDQLNAFEPEPQVQDVVTNETKSNLRHLLLDMTLGYVEISSASANSRSAQYMEAKDTGDHKISLLGGLTNVRIPFGTICFVLICPRRKWFSGGHAITNVLWI